MADDKDKEEYDILDRVGKSIIREIRKSKRFDALKSAIAPELIEAFNKSVVHGRGRSISDFLGLMEMFKSASKGLDKIAKIPKSYTKDPNKKEESRPSTDEEATTEKRGGGKGARSEASLDSFGDTGAEKSPQEIFNDDMLPDFDKKLKELTERYGGGKEGEKMAIQMMAKNNIFLKSISKELPGLTKTILKAAPSIMKGLGVGGAVFGAWRYGLSQQRGWAGLSTAGGRMGIDPAMAIAANTALGGKSLGGGVGSLKLIGNWETAIGRMMRGGSTEFLADLEKYGVDVRGSGFGGFATGEEIFAAVVSKIRQYKKSGDKNLALALADISGIDAAVYEAMDHVEDGDVLRWIRKTGKMSGTDAVAKQRGDTIRDEAGERIIFEWVKSRLFSGVNQPQNSPEAFLAALSLGFADLSKVRTTQSIATRSASLPSQNISAGAYGGDKNVSVNFSGPINVNTPDAESFAGDVAAGAMSSKGSRAAVIDAFDSKTTR